MTHRIAIGGKKQGPVSDGMAAIDMDADLQSDESEGPDPADALIGRVLAGRYRATKVLGRGGIGVVLDGIHLELDKRVAIKVLQAGFARDAEALERFEREAKTAAKIGHPNIVAVLDLGRLETGEPFFVMEHLSGKDLEAELGMPRRALEPKRILSLLGDVGAALDALHKEGVLHRDVKPANVFLAQTKEGEKVKLVDFGLATLADAERKGTRLTREGFIVGTAEYIAPECARGALGGPQADVYSLAVMAYEMLCGVIPFDGAPLDVLMQKVGSRAPVISTYSRKRYPPELDAVLARSLERDPKRRHPTCAALIEELRAVLAQPHVADAADSDTRTPTDELPRTSSNRSGVIALAAVLLLGLAGGVGWMMFGGSSPTTVATETTVPTAPATGALVVPPPTDVVEPSVVEPPPTVVPTGAEAPEVAVVPTTPPPAGGRTPRDRHPGVAATPEVAAEPTAEVRPPPPTRVDPEPTATAEEAPLEGTTHASATDLVRQAQSALLHGEAARARDLFRDATRVSPRHAPAWRGLGIASEQLHEIPEARRAFERYLEISPDASDAATIRARIERL